MTYGTLDDHADDDERLDGLSLAAYGLYMRCLPACLRRGDPHVSAGLVRRVVSWHPDADAEPLSAELQGVGLWIDDEDGWRYDADDWKRLCWQAKQRADKASAGRIGGLKSAAVRREKHGSAQPLSPKHPRSTPEADEPDRNLLRSSPVLKLLAAQGDSRSTPQAEGSSPEAIPVPVPVPVTPLSPNGDISPNGSSNGTGPKHRPPGKREPTTAVLKAFTEVWNGSCAPLPVLRKPPQSADGRRLVQQAWDAADGDVEVLTRAVLAFAQEPWNREHRYGFATLCRHPEHWVGMAACPPVRTGSAWED